jgi:hypothetical protein
VRPDRKYGQVAELIGRVQVAICPDATLYARSVGHDDMARFLCPHNDAPGHQTGFPLGILE